MLVEKLLLFVDGETLIFVIDTVKAVSEDALSWVNLVGMVTVFVLLDLD